MRPGHRYQDFASAEFDGLAASGDAPAAAVVTVAVLVEQIQVTLVAEAQKGELHFRVLAGELAGELLHVVYTAASIMPGQRGCPR